MDDWIEEDLTLQAEASAEKTSRVLDQHVIREPIRILQPRTPLSLPPSATVADAVRMMREHRVGCLLVVASDRLVGIITERDLLLKLEQGDLDRPVSHLMTPDPEVLGLADPLLRRRGARRSLRARNGILYAGGNVGTVQPRARGRHLRSGQRRQLQRRPQ